MNTKHILAIAAILVTTQAFAMDNLILKKGCNGDVGDCPTDGAGGGGNASYTMAYITMGSLWETFEDSKGEFDIETNLTTGKKTVHFGGQAAFLVKPPPANSNMKRSALVHGALAPAPTLAETKKKAAEEKAKAAAEAAAQKAQADAAAAKKAAEAKALAEAIQRAGGVGAHSLGAIGPVSNAPTVGMQPGAGNTNGAATARRNP